MTIRLLIACALLACGAATARPLVIESNDQPPFRTGWLAHSGDELVATVLEWEGEFPEQTYFWAARLYTKVGSQWTHTQTLAREPAPEQWRDRFRVAMNSELIAVGMPSGLRVFERGTAGWVESAVASPRPLAEFVDVHEDGILATTALCSDQAAVLRKNASGQWASTATLNAESGMCIWALDFNENQAIVSAQPPNFDLHGSVRIFENGAGGWTQAIHLPSHEPAPGYWGQGVAIHGNLALVGGRERTLHVYRRRSSGWVETGHLDSPSRGEWDVGASIQITPEYITFVGGLEYRPTGAVFVYRQRPDESLEHLANLVGDREHPKSIGFLSGNRVIALTGDFGTEPIEFNLPASFAVPAIRQFVFEAGDSFGWSPLPGSSFIVADTDDGSWYEQQSTAGDAGAVHFSDYTNQAIEAHVQPLAFNGNDRWVGLMTRYIDDDNYYYVTLRDSNRLVLKRMVGGVYSDLGSTIVDVAPGHRYHLRLESQGSYHAVFLDGTLVIGAWDTTHTHGRMGVRMYKASARFDAITFSPGPTTDHRYANIRATGGNWTGTPTQFQQTQVPVTARHISGTGSVDQVVQAMITVTQFANGGSPWAGLIVRHVDDANYYYVTLRKNNRMSLRKLTNGVITNLGEIELAVTPNQPIVLRVEAIANRIRVYVNGVLKTERNDIEVVSGRVGAMTYLAAARFDVFRAYEP